ncbi:MAG: ATP-binding protein [Azospirillaceae bacterium]|nr:ATP-binding protein [Azospirillaceae bacterium]
MLRRFGIAWRLAGRHPPRLLLIGLLGVLVIAVPWVTLRTIEWTEHQAYEQLAVQGRDRLTLYGVALQSELARSRNIPVVLSSDREVAELLSDQGRDDPTNQHMIAFDRRLESLSASLGVAAVYMLNQQGDIIASSNWQKGSESFVGQHLGFRPYFRATRDGREGRYYAVGSTAREPGYYIAMPVWGAAGVVGAIAVKTVMDELERGWSGGGERVFVTERNGIILITNTPQWRFRTLTPLSAELRSELRTSRQFGNEPLPLLGVTAGAVLTNIAGTDYVMVSQPLPDDSGWTLHVLMDIREAQARAHDRGLLTVAAMGLAILVLYFLVHRGRMMHRHNKELEQRVSERTAALVASNRRLTDEVTERMRVEDGLKSKQDELVQAVKLAALGQMSAGMAHEINQPLAAIRSYADNAVTLLRLGRHDTVRDNLSEIAGLTERMARITGQLKQFARKSSGELEAVGVAHAIESALALLAASLRADGVTLAWTPPATELCVLADGVRLQQVMINLLRNAQDAMRAVAERRLSVEVAVDAGLVHISVRDSGRGIAADAMAQLFDPFFTTKPAGEGLGLGLSISEGIVKGFGGGLSAANHPGGGAVFTLILRRADAE